MFPIYFLVIHSFWENILASTKFLNILALLIQNGKHFSRNFVAGRLHLSLYDVLSLQESIMEPCWAVLIFKVTIPIYVHLVVVIPPSMLVLGSNVFRHTPS